MALTPKALKLRNAYRKAWRAKNKAKNKIYADQYWTKKALEIAD